MENTFGVGAIDYGDGYLSDVPTQVSDNAASEISHDLVASTHALRATLEKTFKDKYQVLRREYERRISSNLESIQSLATNLMSDELIAELKTDAVSAQFIVPHLSELVDRHITNERDGYIHDLIAKNSALELDAAKNEHTIASYASKISHLESLASRGRRAELAIEPLKEKLEALEKEFLRFSSQSEEEIETLRETNDELTTQNESLNARLENALSELNDLKTKYKSSIIEVERLETSFHQTSRDFAVASTSEKREKEENAELKTRLFAVTQARDDLLTEKAAMQITHQHCLEEADRLRAALHERTSKQEGLQDKVGNLMSQVQEMIASETNESNAAIQAMHEKMKQMRHKLMLEVHKEKRLSAALQEELTHARRTKEDSMREFTQATEEANRLRSGLAKEQEAHVASKLQVEKLEGQMTELKRSLVEYQSRCMLAEERLTEERRLHEDDVRIQVEQAKLQSSKDFTEERTHLDQRSFIHMMRQSNERLHHELRQQSQSFAADASIADWTLESQRRQQLQQVELSMARPGQLERSQPQSTEESYILRSRLREASENISRLQEMVVDYRSRLEASQAATQLALQGSSDLQGTSMSGPAARLQTALTEQLSRAVSDGKKRERQLEEEVSGLSEQLQQTRERAHAELQQSTTVIDDMRRKFELLMSSYEATLGTAQEGGGGGVGGGIGGRNNSSASFASSKGFTPRADRYRGAEEDEEKAAAALEPLAEAKEALVLEQRKSATYALRVKRLEAILCAMEKRCLQKTSELRSSMDQIRLLHREATTGVALQLANENERMQSKIMAVLSVHKEQEKALRISLTRTHTIEMETLQAAFAQQLAGQKKAFDADVEKVQSDMILRAESALGLSRAPSTPSSSSARHSAGSTFGQSSVSAGGAFESVLQGVLEALVEGGLLPAPASAELARLAGQHHSDPSFAARSGARLLVSELVQKYKQEQQQQQYSPLGMKQQNLSMSMRMGSGSPRKSGASSGYALDHRVGRAGATGAGYFDISDMGLENLENSSNTTVATSSHSHSILQHLKQMEGESALESLTTQLEHLKKKYKTDVDALQAENKRLEASFRTVLEDEIAQCRAQERAKLTGVEEKLKAERSRRLQLQAQLAELESQHRSVVDELEKQVLLLEQRAEQAEIASTKVRLSNH